MNISFYNGASGLTAYQQEMDVISHNIANVNTVGFKSCRTSFVDLLYSRMAVNEGDFLTGHGVRPAGYDLIFRQGPIQPTSNDLDYAILGDGFFAVERSDGSVEYTRNGVFDVSPRGNKGYLVTTDGSFVLDSKQKRISLDKVNGSNQYDLEGLSNKIGIFTVPNPFGLEPTGGGFLITSKSGDAVAVSKSRNSDDVYQLIPKALEQSGVDLADEMTRVIVSQKAFQFSAKMVQTADQIEEIVNNLR